MPWNSASKCLPKRLLKSLPKSLRIMLHRVGLQHGGRCMQHQCNTEALWPILCHQNDIGMCTVLSSAFLVKLAVESPPVLLLDLSGRLVPPWCVTVGEDTRPNPTVILFRSTGSLFTDSRSVHSHQATPYELATPLPHTPISRLGHGARWARHDQLAASCASALFQAQ